MDGVMNLRAKNVGDNQQYFVRDDVQDVYQDQMMLA